MDENWTRFGVYSSKQNLERSLIKVASVANYSTKRGITWSVREIESYNCFQAMSTVRITQNTKKMANHRETDLVTLERDLSAEKMR